MLVDFIDITDLEVKQDIESRGYSISKLAQGIYFVGEGTLDKAYVIDDISSQYAAEQVYKGTTTKEDILSLANGGYATKDDPYAVLCRKCSLRDSSYSFTVFKLFPKPQFKHILARHIPSWMDYPGKCREPVGSKYDHLIPYLFYVMADEQLWRDMKHLPAGDTRKGQNLASLVNLYAKAIEEKDESILTDDIMTALHQPFVTIEGYVWWVPSGR